MALSAAQKAALRAGAAPQEAISPKTEQKEYIRPSAGDALEPASSEGGHIRVDSVLEALPSGRQDTPDVLEEVQGAVPEQEEAQEDAAVSEQPLQPADQPEVPAKEDLPAGTGIAYKKPSPSGQKGAVRSGKDVKGIPASLIEMCKRASGDVTAPNNKSLAAFLYAFRDKSFDIDYSDVPEDVAAFAEGFDTAKAKREMDRRAMRMEEKLHAMESSQMRILWLALYLVWDRTGFRTDHPDIPSEIGFAQSPEGFEAMLSALDKAVADYVKYDKLRKGRPIR